MHLSDYYKHKRHTVSKALIRMFFRRWPHKLKFLLGALTLKFFKILFQFSLGFLGRVGRDRRPPPPLPLEKSAPHHTHKPLEHMSTWKSRRLEKQMVKWLWNLTACAVAVLSADRTCQRRTFERGAAKANRSTPRPPIRVRHLCLKTSKMLFAGAASEDTALQHLRHICWRPGKCFASNGSINSAYFGCFP